MQTANPVCFICSFAFLNVSNVVWGYFGTQGCLSDSWRQVPEISKRTNRLNPTPFPILALEIVFRGVLAFKGVRYYINTKSSSLEASGRVT